MPVPNRDESGRPNHIEAGLAQMHTGAWYEWTDSYNRIYANLILRPKIWIDEVLVDNPYPLPTEEETNAKLDEIQADFDNAKTKQETDKASGNQKLRDLGLTDDEITAVTKG